MYYSNFLTELPPALYGWRLSHAWFLYLYAKGSQNNAAEDGVAKNAIEDIAFTMDFAGIDLIEELHHDKGVEDDSIVLWGWRMQGSVATTVNVKENLTCG